MPRPFQRFRVVNATPARTVRGSATTRPASNPPARVALDPMTNLPEIRPGIVGADQSVGILDDVTEVEVTVDVQSGAGNVWVNLLQQSYPRSANRVMSNLVVYVSTAPGDDTALTAKVLVEEGPDDPATIPEMTIHAGDSKIIPLEPPPAPAKTRQRTVDATAKSPRQGARKPKPRAKPNPRRKPKK